MAEYVADKIFSTLEEVDVELLSAEAIAAIGQLID